MALLAEDEHDVLPLCFTEAEQDEIARTVDPALAQLAPGHELVYTTVSVEASPDDVVLVTSDAPESRLASRYAAITGRRLLRDATFRSQGSAPRTLTWFCPLDETDMASALEGLHAALAPGPLPPLGVLTAESPARLSWLLAKQLLPSDGDDASTTLVSSEPTAQRPGASLTCVGSEWTVSDAVSTIHRTTGTILINGHSRPHCGLLPTADGLVGICGLASGGADGRCVDGTACHFGEAPRVVLQRVEARRIYFNGCTTAGVGTRRPEFLPPAAMVAHAALRGRVREYVGNVRTGLYGEEDLDWFLGASALGHTPAQSVRVVEAARRATGREVIPSALYFGDASNPAWPVEGVVVGEAELVGERVVVRWSRSDRVLVARVPGATWAELAACDRLHVWTTHPSHPSVSVLADPWSEDSLVLAVPRIRSPAPAGGEGPEDPVSVELRPLAEPIDRTLGETLASAIEHLRGLQGSPTFTSVVADVPWRLEQELVALRRDATARSSLTLLPELLAHWRAQEAVAARRLDSSLVATALTRAQQRWSWGLEYIHRVQAVPRPQRASCPGCGALAIDIDYVDHASPRMVRTVEVCGYCGIVEDLPAWPLRPRLLDETLHVSSTELRGRVEIDNVGARPRVVVLGATVRGAGQMRPSSRAMAELEIAPSATASFDFSLLPELPMTELMQTWVFVASEGAIGLVGRMLLFGRKPAEERP